MRRMEARRELNTVSIDATNPPSSDALISSAASGVESQQSVQQAFRSSRQLTKEEAIAAVLAIASANNSGESTSEGRTTISCGSEYVLVRHEDVTARSGLHTKSSNYKGWYLLCASGTLRHLGYAVCPFALDGSCPAVNAVRVYSPASGGTSTYARHLEVHRKRSMSSLGRTGQNVLDTGPRKATKLAKKCVATSAAVAVVADSRPISWAEPGKGIEVFARAIFKEGQRSGVMDEIDMADLLPSGEAVANQIRQMSTASRIEDKRLL
jgi:hypothetical protein